MTVLDDLSRQAVNVGLLATDGGVWIAGELWNADPLSPEVFLWLVRRGSQSTDRVRLSDGELSSAFMYPALLTWHNANNVVVVGKQDNLLGGSGEAQLKLFTQDRDDFSIAFSSEVAVADVGEKAGRPHIDRNTNPEQHLCWTKTNSVTGQDLTSKSKDSASWLNSTERSINITSDEDDHCELSFFENGVRNMVLHSDAASGDNSPTNDIWLDQETGSGALWVSYGHFALPAPASNGVKDMDFPSVQTRASGVPGFDRSVVVAQVEVNSEFRLAEWMCEGDVTTCNTAIDWTGALHDFSPNVRDPKLLVVRNSVGFVHYDHFVVFNDVNAGANPVFLASQCNATDATDAWTFHGVLPLPPSTGLGQTWQFRGFGTQPASAVQSITIDDGEIFVSYIVQDSVTLKDRIAIYTFNQADACP